MKDDIINFRLLTELYSFLLEMKSLNVITGLSGFPSPCGVLFILTLIKKTGRSM